MNGASQPAVLGWEWGIESEEEGLGTAPVAMPHQGCQLHGRELPVMATSGILRCQQLSASENQDEEFNRKYRVLHH